MALSTKSSHPSKVQTVSTSVMIAIFLLLGSQYPLASSETINLGTFETQQASQNRTLDYYWYSFFNVSMIRDVWEAREDNYATQVLSWMFPVVYEETVFQGSKLPDGRLNPHPEGGLWYYTSAKLRVKGRNLPEINITHPEFVPYNLLKGLSPTVAGGNLNISYHMQYITEARARQLKVYSPGTFDGYISELNGTLTMDENATQRILGLAPEEYEILKADPAGWWDNNEKTVEAKWEDFLIYEANIRLNILPMFLDPYVVFSSNVFPGVDLSLEYNALTDQVVLRLDVVAWGNEALLARWFRETFMKGYEAWYSDLYLDVAVGPSSSDVGLDTNVDWALYQWSANSEKYAPGVWVFEPYLGDEAGRIKYRGKIYPSSELAPYMFPNGTFKSYYNVAPGNAWYDECQPYDYAPSPWNLLEGETIRINYTLPGPVWVLQQKPDGTLKNETGTLGVSLIKPYPESFQGQITLNTTNQIVTFTGPMNVEEWSKINCPDQWMRLADNNHPEGALPLGLPYIEFYTYAKVIPEFPAWTSMLLILIVLTVAIVIYKRKLLKTSIH